jgi:hypothetical protein
MDQLARDLRDLEENELPELRARLAPLERGEFRVSVAKGNEPLVDITESQIAFLKRTIAMYEHIIAQLRRRGAV